MNFIPDNKIDADYSTIVNLQDGELMFPCHLPFAYDAMPRIDTNGNFILQNDYPGYTLLKSNKSFEFDLTSFVLSQNMYTYTHFFLIQIC